MYFRTNVVGTLSGRITVEVQDWRHHEADWFAAMQGATLEISDPGRSDVRNEESEYVISKSSFDEKIVKLPDAQVNKAEVRMYVGTLDITGISGGSFGMSAAPRQPNGDDA